VHYEAVNAMLLNEFLKKHRKVAEQEAIITQLKAASRATAAHQQKQIDALTAGLQKVSDPLEIEQIRTAKGVEHPVNQPERQPTLASLGNRRCFQ
jgi:hypothetical protein